MSPLDRTREAFVSRMHHVVNLAKDGGVTRQQIDALVASLEAHLEEFVRPFSEQETGTR